MRKIDIIVVHCSASDVQGHDNVAVIKEWHLERGFSDIGYHYIITKDGDIHVGRPLHISGAHCRGYNARSIGICLTGNEEFSDEQFKSLRELVNDLIIQFGLERKDVVPHNALNSHKTCPNFDLTEALDER